MLTNGSGRVNLGFCGGDWQEMVIRLIPGRVCSRQESAAVHGNRLQSSFQDVADRDFHAIG